MYSLWKVSAVSGPGLLLLWCSGLALEDNLSAILVTAELQHSSITPLAPHRRARHYLRSWWRPAAGAGPACARCGKAVRTLNSSEDRGLSAGDRDLWLPSLSVLVLSLLRVLWRLGLSCGGGERVRGPVTVWKSGDLDPVLIVSLTKLPRLSRLSLSFEGMGSAFSGSLLILILLESDLELGSWASSSLMMVRGDMVGGVLKLVKGVLLPRLRLVEAGLSRSGLNTESEENLRSDSFCLRSRPSLESVLSRDTLPLAWLVKLVSDSRRGEKSMEERLSLLFPPGYTLSSLSLSRVSIFSSAWLNTSSLAETPLVGSVFSLPSSWTVFNDGVDFCVFSRDRLLVAPAPALPDRDGPLGLGLKRTEVTVELWAAMLWRGALGFRRSYTRILPRLEPTARLTPSWSKSAEVSGASHCIIMICFLALVSQHTSRLSRPTDRASVSLMGLKVMAVAGAMCGLSVNRFLFVLQSQKESIPLSHAAPSNDGYTTVQ